ncbi:MAG TPA: DNA mismatch repair protein MutS [Desulfovibrio piger]|uniref:DNA mismatch repair protein MutS n=2 Tax=Desulfovibrio piger TaxID=901 RepID=B6WRY4_9BACT|nr:DNA mismatch repair protein MutS [Desulfovibrio piger]EEB34142.1 DNA mismatch repair protein MutS [Desulfovibrio piger ATCC 29098]HCZ44582.1 DNA mismatch repair protein MutS [Desulfovibrio piger]
MAEKTPKLTPMFEQYLRIKADYPDALLFYRMGDFYELFFDDAVTAARELQIALTSRSRDTENPVPMCGVPWHAAQAYIAQLIDKGFHVAICDQTEDPKAAKGLVQRAVTCVVTPGTVLEDANLDARSHNYLGAAFWEGHNGAFVWADISTGQWSGMEVKRLPELWQWIQKLAPRELLVPDDKELPPKCLLEGVRLLRRPVAGFDARKAERRLLEAQSVQELAALGLQNKPCLVRACGALLVYLEQTQKRRPEHLMPFQPLDLGRHMLVDDVTERNLEIFQRLNGRKGKGTLRHVLDDTMTPMGGRLLEDMLRHPWREAAPILAVQDAVALLHDDDNRRALLREALKDVYDLERLSTRVTVNRATPRDFIALGNSLAALPAVLAALTQPLDGKYPLPGQENGEDAPRVIHELLKGWDDLADCAHLLRSALVDSPPVVITDGGLFKAGYNAELDRLLDLVEHGEQKLQEELAREQQETGIAKLKLGFNRVFGYYYELSKAAHSGPVPEHFIRRQTLANAERFTTPALKELEEALLSASEKRKTLEYQLYQDLRTFMAQQRERILHMADVIAHLDYWQSLAEVGRRNGWCRPELDGSADILIEEGRHPVVEAMIGTANFVPNNITLDAKRRLCLLTGPNMAGKSTVLRQVAIICLLAQTGSMVPATRARLGLVDRLFSRVGASDNLAQGQSTFMVEMMETARILRQATKRSLVILDEIGRGTSTYDGVALAWAVVEDLAARAHGEVRTLFATHYHELTALEKRVPGVFTMNIAIREYGGDILFLHKLVPGPADRSYGVEVARLAGVPAPVVQRARAILAELEQSRGEGRRMSPQTETLALPGMEKRVAREEPPSLPIDIPAAPAAGPHPLVLLLRDLDPDELSPLAALKLIMEWKKLWADAPDTEEKHV